MEKLPALWDMCSPKYNDEVLVTKQIAELEREHQKIFELPKMASSGVVEDLLISMIDKYHETFVSMAYAFGDEVLSMSREELLRSGHYRRANTFADNYCSYATSMKFMVHSDQLEKELLEERDGIKWIECRNGHMSVQYLDGHIDDLDSVPLCLIKLKLTLEFQTFMFALMKKKFQAKTRLDTKITMAEVGRAMHCYEKVMTMKDDQ